MERSDAQSSTAYGGRPSQWALLVASSHWKELYRLQSKRPLFLSFFSLPFCLHNTYIRFRDLEKRESWGGKIQKTAHTLFEYVMRRDVVKKRSSSALQISSKRRRWPKTLRLLFYYYYYYFHLFLLSDFWFDSWKRYTSLRKKGEKTSNNQIQISVYITPRPTGTNCWYLVSLTLRSSNTSKATISYRGRETYVWNANLR